MNCRPLLLVSLIALQSGLLGCSDPQNTAVSEVENDGQAIQKSSGSDAINAAQKNTKPSESEAIEAAVAYLNREGQLTVEETEFIAWGTYSEQLAYWPIKFRMAYKPKGSDSLRHNDYALKISKDPNGQWKAAQYYAWRTDFK